MSKIPSTWFMDAPYGEMRITQVEKIHMDYALLGEDRIVLPVPPYIHPAPFRNVC